GEAMGIPSGNGPYPTIYIVCPNRVVTNVGQASAATLWDAAQAASCQAATEPVDPALVDLSTTGDGCDGVYSASVNLMNLGTETLTSATVTANGCANCPISMDWTGSLESYEVGSVTIDGIEVSGTQEVTFDVTSSGDANLNNNAGGVQLLASDHTTVFNVTIQTDTWPGETTWELFDANGNVVNSGGPYGDGTGAQQDAELVFESFAASGDLGCWEFKIYDSYGDGMFASQYGGVDGFASIETVSNGETSLFYQYPGGYDFNEDSGRGNVTTVSVTEADALQASMNVFPNPVRDNAQLKFTLPNASEVTYEVTDMLGKVVLSENLGTLAAGTATETLNLQGMEAGIYMVRVNAAGSVATMKITLTK
ncbi:MAG: T9SS type A sorting domain-containing protein, partial [Bacteroidota bacterium]